MPASHDDDDDDDGDDDDDDDGDDGDDDDVDDDDDDNDGDDGDDDDDDDGGMLPVDPSSPPRFSPPTPILQRPVVYSLPLHLKWLKPRVFSRCLVFFHRLTDIARRCFYI